MASINKITKQYKDEGYVIAKSIFSKEYCNELKDYLETLDIKRYIPFSNIAWGWGNLLDKGPFSDVTRNKFINDFSKSLFGETYIFNHLMVNNKAPWIGPDVEWHQEASNIDTYAPGYSFEESDNFLQIYIALDKQNRDNGCLQFIEGSDKLGLLPNEDFIDGNLGHKRRVTSKALDKLIKNHKISYGIMDVGDVLLFNHRLVHSSAPNKSNLQRKSIILGVRNKIKEDDFKIFKKETDYRRDFIINNLSDMIEQWKSKNIYSDFKKEDK